MTMLAAIIVAMASTVALIIVVTPLIVAKAPRLARLAHALDVLAIVLTLITGTLAANAMAQGMWTLDTPLEDVIEITLAGNTPYDESSGVADTTSSVIAFYRYGCPDCEATHDDIERWAKDEDITLYWVSTRSERGRELFVNSGLAKVPSLMATDAHGDTLIRVAYLVDPTTDEASIDETALDAIAAFVRGES